MLESWSFAASCTVNMIVMYEGRANLIFNERCKEIM